MRRSAYTLLEILLALGIAMLLLGALYVAVDVQLRFAQAGRDRVEVSTLARSLFGRMSADASATVGLADAGRYRTQSSSSTTTTPMTTTDPTMMMTTEEDPEVNPDLPVTVPLGVVGDSTILHLYISKIPRELTYAQPDTAPVLSDFRRVSYWLLGGSEAPSGLARQEVKIVTSDDATRLPPDVENDTQYLMADEVRSLSFSYFDGTGWVDTWDSTELGADGKTPIGSPRAIAVTIEIAQPGKPNAPLKLYRHVIALPTANGATAQSTTPTDPTMMGGGTTSP